MTTNAPAGHKDPANDSRDALESLDRPNTLGTDAEGCVHHHSPYDARVVVVAADGSIEATADLSGRAVDEWIDFISEGRGWDELAYADSLAEALAL